MPPKRFDNGGDEEWILRRQAAAICSVSERTIHRWLSDKKSHPIRTKVVRRGQQKITLLHRGDVERIRSAGLEHPLEQEITARLLRGESPAAVLRHLHVPLAEFEQIRDQFVRVTGGSNLTAPHVRDICEALETPELNISLVVDSLQALCSIRKRLDIGQADSPALVARAVKELLESHERLVAAERRRASDVRAIVKPLEEATNPIANDASPPSASKVGTGLR
jgi:hypothetical protein